jgi:hypothetical protein
MYDGYENNFRSSDDIIISEIIELMNNLEDNKRLDILLSYCRGCGSEDTNCQCLNDE